MFYEVIEITETAWGEDKILRGRFDTLAQAVDFIEVPAGFEIVIEDEISASTIFFLIK